MLAWKRNTMHTLASSIIMLFSIVYFNPVATGQGLQTQVIRCTTCVRLIWLWKSHSCTIAFKLRNGAEVYCLFLRSYKLLLKLFGQHRQVKPVISDAVNQQVQLIYL